MSIPLQFASLCDGQEVFKRSDCLLDLGTDFLVGNMVFANVNVNKMLAQREEYAVWSNFGTVTDGCMIFNAQSSSQKSSHQVNSKV